MGNSLLYRIFQRLSCHLSTLREILFLSNASSAPSSYAALSSPLLSMACTSVPNKALINLKTANRLTRDEQQQNNIGLFQVSVPPYLWTWSMRFPVKVWLISSGMCAHFCTDMRAQAWTYAFVTYSLDYTRTNKTSLNSSEEVAGETRHWNICGPHWVVLIQNSSGKNNLNTKAKNSYSIFSQSTSCALKRLLRSCGLGESILVVLW